MSGEKGWSWVLNEPVRLLVVDDDPILREFAKVHLSTPTATVEAAADGAEGWRMLQEEPFDAVLLDIEMPVMDGFELLERIRGDRRLADLPCVMMTGREDIEAIDRAFALGSDSFTVKPVNWRLLSYHLRHVLRPHRVEGGSEVPAAPASRDAPATTTGEAVRDALATIVETGETLLAGATDETAIERLQTIVWEGRRAARLLEGR